MSEAELFLGRWGPLLFRSFQTFILVWLGHMNPWTFFGIETHFTMVALVQTIFRFWLLQSFSAVLLLSALSLSWFGWETWFFFSRNFVPAPCYWKQSCPYPQRGWKRTCGWILPAPGKKPGTSPPHQRSSFLTRITLGQTFYDLPTHLHLLYRIFNAIRINKCHCF